MKVKDLKVMLQAFGLDTKGKKVELVDRLEAHAQALKAQLVSSLEDNDDEEEDEEEDNQTKVKLENVLDANSNKEYGEKSMKEVEDMLRVGDTISKGGIVINAYDKPPVFKLETTLLDLKDHMERFDAWKSRHPTTIYPLVASFEAAIIQGWVLSGRLQPGFSEVELRSAIRRMISRESTTVISIQGEFRHFVFVVSKRNSAEENARLFRDKILKLLQRNNAQHYLQNEELRMKVFSAAIRKITPYVIAEELFSRMELDKAKKEKIELFQLEDMLMHEINQFWKYNKIKEDFKQRVTYDKYKEGDENKVKVKGEFKQRVKDDKFKEGDENKAKVKEGSKQRLNNLQIKGKNLIEFPADILLTSEVEKTVVATTIMFDSGANVNAMGIGEFLKIIALSKQLPFQLQSCCSPVKAVGKAIEVWSVAKDLQLKINNAVIKTDVLILKSDLPHIILGKQVMQGLGLDLEGQMKNLTEKTITVTIQTDTPMVSRVNNDMIGGVTPSINMLQIQNTSGNEEKEEEISKLKLFPIYDKLSFQSRLRIDKIYGNLQEWFYNGSEHIIGEPFKVRIKEGMQPCFAKTRRLPPKEHSFLATKAKQMEEKGYWSRTTYSDWGSFMFAVPKVNSAEGLRAVVDFTAVNNRIEDDNTPLPLLDAMLYQLQQSRYFGILDAEKGYQQIEVADDGSRDILGIITPIGVMKPSRLIEGVKTAVAHFQRVIANILSKKSNNGYVGSVVKMNGEDLDVSHHLSWIDDIMLHEVNEMLYLDLLEDKLVCLKDYRVKLNIRKCILMTDSVTFAGYRFNASGVSFDEKRISTLLRIPLPMSADQLMSFINSVNWIRRVIPDYTKIAAPLYDLLKKICDRVSSTKKKAVKGKKLEWCEEAISSFNLVKNAIAKRIMLAYPKDGYSILMVTDASDLFFGVGIFQFKGDIKAVTDYLQAEVEPLGFISGRWTGSQERWDIQSKEMETVIKGLNAFSHFISGKVLVATDNRNLTFAMKADNLPNASVQTLRRIIRQREKLGMFDVDFLLIPGKVNWWSDLLSRWGASNEEIIDNDSNQINILLMDSPMSEDFVWPSEKEIINEQMEQGLKFPKEVKQDTSGVWRNEKNGALYVVSDKMKCRIFVAAHAGAYCHRSLKETREAINSSFFWEDMKNHIEQLHKNCIHCIQAKSTKVPRPWGSIVKGENPNEVIHLDFYQVSFTGKNRWLMVLTESFSTFTVLLPVKAVTAEEAARGLQEWCIRYGVPKWITTDKGSCFTADLFHQLGELMKIKHHMIVSYIHTGNSIVERKCRVIKQMFRSLSSEHQLESDDWNQVLGLIQFGLNNYKSDRLLGRSPRQAFLSLDSDIPLLPLRVENDEWKLVDSQQLQSHFEEYFKAREEERVLQIEEIELKRKKLRENNDKYRLKFNPQAADYIVGDFVLVAKESLQSKHAPRWDGPYVVVDAETPYVFKVKSLVTDQVIEVHASRLIGYSNTLMNSDRGIKEQALYNNKGFRVQEFLNFKKVGKEYVVQVKWLGLEEVTEEPAKTMYEAAPDILETMLKKSDKSKHEKKIFARYLKISEGAM